KGENSDNLKAMTLMDLHILDEPTAGVITMQNMLEEHGLRMSYERVRRLMRKAAIMPIYPRRMHVSQNRSWVRRVATFVRSSQRLSGNCENNGTLSGFQCDATLPESIIISPLRGYSNLLTSKV